MENAPRIRDKPLLVDPAGFAFWRVIGRKVVRIRAATQHRLVNRTFFFRPAKLVFFFLPQDADIAKRRLNGFQLQRIVAAAKIDRLAGFFQHDFQRRQLAVELIVQPQLIDRPFHLGIHAVFQGVAHLADDTGVHRRVVFHQLDDFQGYIRRFQAAAAALEDVRHVRLNAPVDVDKRPAEDARGQFVVRRCARRRPGFLLFLDAQRLLQITGRPEAVSDGGFHAELVFFFTAHNRCTQFQNFFHGCSAVGFDFRLALRYIAPDCWFAQVLCSDCPGRLLRVTSPTCGFGCIA